jgi:hypothetical protein
VLGALDAFLSTRQHLHAAAPLISQLLQVLERLEAWQSSLPVPCQVLLMPAVRDAFHHPTFPQPAVNLMAQDQVGAALFHMTWHTLSRGGVDGALFTGFS